MQIVVNHLTRMHEGRICVAGINPVSRRHVRPVPEFGETFERGLLAANGQQLRVGALVDLGDVSPRPDLPHSEDQVTSLSELRLVRYLDRAEYLRALESVRVYSLTDAFGTELDHSGRSFTLKEGTGKRSLAVLRKNTREIKVEIKKNRKTGKETVRLACRLAGKRVNLSLTDLRLYKREDETTLDREMIGKLQDQLAQANSCYLMLGLGRAWSPDQSEPVHWLQANGIAVAD